MEKDKMIEELANDIPAEMKDPYQGSNITVLYSYRRREQIAKCLVSKNYRKVHEGAVVLKKEEIKSGITYYDVVKDIIRKETKREVLKKLNGFRFVMYDEDEDGEENEIASWTCDEDDVKQFAKEIGAEV